MEICGAGCTYEEGQQNCHMKTVASFVDTPEEVCDLNPQKTCRHVTKLVPKLAPSHECTIVPKETCHLKFSSPEVVKEPLKSIWCLDPTPPTPGDSYEEAEALGPILNPRNEELPDSFEDRKPDQFTPPPTSYISG